MEAHTQDELRIAQVGNLAHERLVAHRATAQDTPYTKHTTDSDWVMKHGTAMVDLATCAYHDLPKDWKHERDAGAAIAIRAVLQAVRDGIPLDDTFIEQTSELLHNKWLERNMHRASLEQALTYGEMSDHEKEKDRIFVRAALEILVSKAPGQNLSV